MPRKRQWARMALLARAPGAPMERANPVRKARRAGCRVRFFLVTSSCRTARRSNSPCKAKPVVQCRGKRCVVTHISRQEKFNGFPIRAAHTYTNPKKSHAERGPKSRSCCNQTTGSAPSCHWWALDSGLQLPVTSQSANLLHPALACHSRGREAMQIAQGNCR